MKIKVLLLAFGCSMMSFGAYAQKGVDTGTPFGSGEDSVRCITNIILRRIRFRRRASSSLVR